MTESVLFVDDETLILDYLRILFAGEGVRILFANNGAQALEIAGRERISVLVADYRLPVMNGMDLVRLVRERSTDTVPIIMSGYSEFPALRDHVHRERIFRIIPKPWKGVEMVTAVREAIAESRELRGRKGAEGISEHPKACAG
ncbi:response regulator [Geobacter sp.]|uniref:response regulator n=1 Tax=Geobacter sp. TaxID=46610 RepID=UPI00263996B3|nr:response regulator [Geobacter sp.]